MNEYIKGGIVGGATVFIGYPLDTMKTCIQNKQKISYSISHLYKGISYPLAFSVLFNSTYSHYIIIFKRKYIIIICLVLRRVLSVHHY